jgi:hypothetical protein
LTFSTIIYLEVVARKTAHPFWISFGIVIVARFSLLYAALIRIE